MPDDGLNGEPTLRGRVESDKFVGRRFIIDWEAHQRRWLELRQLGMDARSAYRFLADERQWSAGMPGVMAIPAEWRRCRWCGWPVPERDRSFRDSACEICWTEAHEGHA